MTRPSALRPLTTRGVKVLSGDFRLSSGIVFSRVDIVCNNVPLDKSGSRVSQTS